jgi:multimeric flavodoxin WrbA
MKIEIINGSPKTAGISARIIEQIEKLLGEQIEIHNAAQLVHQETPKHAIAGMLEADILLIVFPLYVDSLPSPLIELLTRLESAAHRGTATPRIFTIVNAAFESAQTTLALEMIEHFTRRAGFSWGYGIGIGAGTMLYNAGENWEKGFASSVHDALFDLTTAMKEKISGPNIYIEPKFPRFLYKAIANFGFWFGAKRNGGSKLQARPYINH